MTPTLLLCALALGANETEVLWFTSANCQHCKASAPIIDRLTEAGVPVKKIDVDVHREVTQRFNITAVPTTILLRGGREADRLIGPASFDRLVQMIDNPAAGGAKPNAGLNAGPNPAPNADDIPRRAIATAVRLKVADPSGLGVGTGTVIDKHGAECLILTCGHIFRESKGRGKVHVEFFAPGARGAVEGQVIDYNLEHDVALVACRPGFDVQPAPVAGPEHRSQVGDAVFTIGCNQGADPTVMVSRVTSVDKYHGHPNLTAKGAPVTGRSGGGIFTADGRLIGVCNAADTKDDEGVYASLPAVHGHLDTNKLARIYQSAPPVANAVPSPADPSRIADSNPPPRFDERMPFAPNLNPALPPESKPAAPDDAYDIVVTIRPKNNPQAQPQSFVLRQLPPELQQRLLDPRVAGRTPDIIIRGQN